MEPNENSELFIDVLMPEFANDFTCSGKDCKENCCERYWNIFVDKETYQYYKMIDYENIIPSFKPITNNIIVKNKNRKKVNKKSNIHDYAKINLIDGHICPYLTKDKLCGIYSLLGEEHQSSTCKIYPRTVNILDNNFELSLMFSCKEVIRSAMKYKDPIKFKTFPTKITKNNKVIYSSPNMAINRESSNKIEIKFFDLIRTPSIWILQDRDFDLSTRIVILGLYYKEIINLFEKEKPENIPEKAKSTFILLKEQFKNSPLTVEKNYVLQFKILSYYIYLLRNLINRTKYIKNNVVNLNNYLIPKEFHENINLYLENKENQEIFNKKYKSLLLKFKEEINKNSIFEHFLVNEYFRLFMPFGNFKTIWESYLYICITFSITRYMLLGEIANSGTINDENFIDCFYEIANNFLHKNSLPKDLVKQMENDKLDDLNNVYPLIFN